MYTNYFKREKFALCEKSSVFETSKPLQCQNFQLCEMEVAANVCF